MDTIIPTTPIDLENRASASTCPIEILYFRGLADGCAGEEPESLLAIAWQWHDLGQGFDRIAIALRVYGQGHEIGRMIHARALPLPALPAGDD